MKKLKLLFMLSLALMIGKMAAAQDTLEKVIPKKSYFKLTGGYLTNAVYNGRKDSVATPYITGAFGYYHKSGFSLSGSIDYQPNTNTVAVFALDANYSWDLSDKFNILFDANKPFYNSSSTAVQSGIKGTLGADFVYSPGIISIEAGINSVVSDKADIMVNGVLSHQFAIDGGAKGTSFNITPGATVNLGTQNFYQTYLARSAKKKNAAVTSSSVSGTNNFGVLDYELSLPIGYDGKKWGISIIPIYAIPQNAIVTTTTNTIAIFNKTYSTTSKSTEQLQNVFYAQFSVYIKF